MCQRRRERSTPAPQQRAGLVVFKSVSDRKEGVRPRILWYWSDQKSFRSVQIPSNGISLGGFQIPQSGRGAVVQLVGRVALWFIGKKWPSRFQYDPWTNQLTISMGGKLERQGS